MTPTTTRIGRLGVVFACGFAIVLAHLGWLMLRDHEVWARRSHDNHWAFRSVPSQRGTLFDRFGERLAFDVPTTQFTVNYQRFRQRHPVGAAVHAATLLASLQPATSGTAYDYSDGLLGAEAAARDVLAMPAVLLRRGVLDKEVAAELRTAVTTVLAAASGWSRRDVYARLREAAQAGRGTLGEALGIPAAELLAACMQAVARLRQLDAELAQLERQRVELRALATDEALGLLGTLELLRRASLARERVTWTEKNADGEDVQREGSLIETVRRVFASHVPFERAAALRISAELYPGLEVSPASSRELAEGLGATLPALLGTVVELDRAIEKKAAGWSKWLASYHDRELPADWSDEMLPEGIVDSDAARAMLRNDLDSTFENELRRLERVGLSGVETAFDSELMGRLGMRFVEHDSRRREQQLWGHLQVEAGVDLRLTFDTRLQVAAERAVRTTWQQQRDRYFDEEKQAKVEAAIAIIDANSGDVLAYAGWPIVSALARDVPGVIWSGNGALGSVVKPLVLVEQLQSELVGRPHRALASLEPCTGTFPYGGKILRCVAHYEAGRDPVEAIAESCNAFFYQCGIGLGDEGLARALRRFGLLEAPPGDPFAVCWQRSVRGLRVGAPVMSTVEVPKDAAGGPDGARQVTPRYAEVLPKRAIGYGVQASPLHVARAYAAFATGALPTLGVRVGEPRSRVPLHDVVAEMAVVQQGLAACVDSGTGKRLKRLQALGVSGKTGTAEVTDSGNNNAWFAGYLPAAGPSGMQLTFCAVVYFVPDGVHGADAAGRIVDDLLGMVQSDAVLAGRYLAPTEGR